MDSMTNFRLRCVKACLRFCVRILHSFVVKVTFCGYHTRKAAPICTVPMWVKGQFLCLVSKNGVSLFGGMTTPVDHVL